MNLCHAEVRRLIVLREGQLFLSERKPVLMLWLDGTCQRALTVNLK